MDYRKSCQQALDDFEQCLRGFVKHQMGKGFGGEWWKTNVPESIATECNKRLRKEQSNRFPILPASEPIDYTNMGELKDVICRRDNFTKVFKPYFGNTGTIDSKLSELIAFRNPAAHNRSVFGLDQNIRL